MFKFVFSLCAYCTYVCNVYVYVCLCMCVSQKCAPALLRVSELTARALAAYARSSTMQTAVRICQCVHTHSHTESMPGAGRVPNFCCPQLTRLRLRATALVYFCTYARVLLSILNVKQADTNKRHIYTIHEQYIYKLYTLYYTHQNVTSNLRVRNNVQARSLFAIVKYLTLNMYTLETGFPTRVKEK